MRKFDTLEAVAAPLPIKNIDTDKIIPARFLTTISRLGLGNALFASLRSDPDFVLNRAPWNDAEVIVAFENFGCGSSREHAPWALLDFGIRCVIAPSFADIFYNNCFNNGILPIILPISEIERLLSLVGRAECATINVDLVNRIVASSDGQVVPFSIDEKRRSDLMNGSDPIAKSLQLSTEVDAWERSTQKMRPWIWGVTPAHIKALR